MILLATTMIHGVTVSGQAEAIDQVDGFLGRWRCGTRTRPWWPGMISTSEWSKTAVDQPGPQRPSWCYGTPGLARARQLAALALDLPRRRVRAEAALVGCVTDDTQLAQLGDDSLCHGWAGLVHTTWRAAADAGPDSELARVLPHLQCRWRQRRTRARPQLSDRGGMLEGSTGIALVRHSIEHTARPGEWDVCLLTTSPYQENTRMEGTR